MRQECYRNFVNLSPNRAMIKFIVLKGRFNLPWTNGIFFYFHGRPSDCRTNHQRCAKKRNARRRLSAGPVIHAQALDQGFTAALGAKFGFASDADRLTEGLSPAEAEAGRSCKGVGIPRIAIRFGHGVRTILIGDRSCVGIGD